jgi:uncharacterized membrane protein
MEEAKVEEQTKTEEKVGHTKEKKTILVSMPKIRGKNRFETVENFSILFIGIGSVILALGMVIAGFNTVGLGPILAMMGTLIAFLATIVLVFSWLVKEFSSD